MHPIKREILQRLILNSSQKFSQLKPDDIESNHFIYYLRQLMGEGLVTKVEEQYTLSEKGKHLASRISLKDLTVRLQPKTVTAPVCFSGGKVLLYKWRREPGYGQTSLISGKLHFGEALDEAVNRELLEKTGLVCELTLAGSVYIREYRNGQIFSHQLAHVFKGDDPNGSLKPTKVGKPVWVDSSKLDEVDLMPGTKEILEFIDQGGIFFKELEFKTG